MRSHPACSRLPPAALQFYREPDDLEVVLGELLPEALAGMTGLTYLSFVGHGMPFCPAEVASLPALKVLDLSMNPGLTELPYGPWPALKSLGAGPDLIDAALAHRHRGQLLRTKARTVAAREQQLQQERLPMLRALGRSQQTQAMLCGACAT